MLSARVKKPPAHTIIVKPAVCIFTSMCFLVLATNRADTKAKPQNVHGWLIEIDIYSGRQNPVCAISNKTYQRLLKQLEAAPPRPAGPLNNTLGYRGVIIRSATGALLVSVSNGVIVETRNGISRSKADTDRGFERWLIKQTRGCLDRNLLHDILKQFG
jgi:hypothetical protein